METFDEMLNDLYLNLNLKKTNLKLVLPDPVLVKSGNKTIWKNVNDFIKLCNRDSEHFINYINTESSTQAFWVSDIKEEGCIFTTKTKKDYVYELMKKYITDQILCKSCQSLDTKIEKNKELRKYKFICNNCKNEYFK